MDYQAAFEETCRSRPPTPVGWADPLNHCVAGFWIFIVMMMFAAQLLCGDVQPRM